MHHPQNSLGLTPPPPPPCKSSTVLIITKKPLSALCHLSDACRNACSRWNVRVPIDWFAIKHCPAMPPMSLDGLHGWERNSPQNAICFNPAGARAIPRLLMPWRRKEPGHQQPWYWFCQWALTVCMGGRETAHKMQFILTLLVLKPACSGWTRAISRLLMPWRRKAPGHQQPWYWFCQ